MKKLRWFPVITALVLLTVPLRASAACTGFPAGTATDDYVLLMSGTPKITNKGNAGANGIAGAVTYDAASNTLQVCNGTSWASLGASGAAGYVQFSGGSGAFAADSGLYWDNANKRLGIGTSAPDSSAVLDVSSTTRGFLPPRMTEAQIMAIVSPAEGLMVYDMDSASPIYFDGNAWKGMDGSGQVVSQYGYFVYASAAGKTDAGCRTDLRSNDWVGKSDSSVNVDSKVRTFACTSSGCPEGKPNTTYRFAVIGSTTRGGASFTTDANGVGPGDTSDWSGSTYFGSGNYWTGRSSGASTSWGTTPAGTCNDWTASTGVNGEYGTSGTGTGRWASGSKGCQYAYGAICIVDP